MILHNGLINHSLQERPDLVQRGRHVVELIDQRIADTVQDDWKPGGAPKEGLKSFTRRDYNPNSGEVDAQYHDPETKQRFSVHLSYDPATGRASSFHQTISQGYFGGSEKCLMETDGQGRQIYDYACPDGKGIRVVLDQKRDVVAILEGEVAPHQELGSVPADNTPVSREELSARLVSFRLPIDSDLHHTYRNQPWFIPVMESFMQKLGADIGTYGNITPQGMYLQTRLSLNDGSLGEVPSDNTFGGIKSIPGALNQELYSLVKEVASPGFAEGFRQAYVQAELGLKP